MKDIQRIYLLGILLVVIVAVVAFYAGVMFQRIHTNQFFRGRPGMMYGNMPRRFGMGTGFRPNGMGSNGVTGQITDVSGNQLTLKLPDGTTRTIPLTSSTQYIQTVPANQSALKQGEMVTITNQTQNGSTSAQVIRITAP